MSAMFLAWRGRIIPVLVLAATLLLGGCSALRLGYGQAPDIAYWWLDGYADFDGPQSDRVRAGLADWLVWHRSTQLNDYAGLLAQWRAQAAGELTPAQVCAASDAARDRLQRAVERTLPVAAEVARTLRPEQLQHMERRMKKGLDEAREEFAQPDVQQRQAAAFKRALERAEGFYGRLDERQRALLAKGLAASPFDAQAWLGERQQLQLQHLAQLRQLLAERADAPRMEAALRAMLAAALNSPRPAYRAYQQRLADYNCQLGAQLHNSSTGAQRKRLADKLKGWEDDLRVLAGQAASPASRTGLPGEAATAQ
jgi:hypothetical protein